MKKLKVYKNPDFRLVEVQLEGSACDALHDSNKLVSGKPESGGGGSTGGGEGTTTPEFDAAFRRNGIWDEE